MWPNQQETAYLVTFTEEILNGKLHFLCSDSYSGSLVVDTLNAVNFKVDDKTYLTIQEVQSKESGQYTVKGCLRWIKEIQTSFNRVNQTKLRENVLKDETSHICLTVWGSHIPKFKENCWFEITDLAIKNYYGITLSCQLHRQL